jgi:hypothetical protein
MYKRDPTPSSAISRRARRVNEEELQRPVADDDQQRIDFCRRVKSVGPMHKDHGEANRHSRGPGLRAREGHHGEADGGREEVSAARGCAGFASGPYRSMWRRG